jgi:EmrB/QacA subfamily drug resistance transporter
LLRNKPFTHSITLIAASLALFMEALDTTIINTAIPAMSDSLNVNPVDLKIALISYLLSLAVFIPISGWVADRFTMKRVFINAVFIFVASSLWCGLTHTLHELVIARAFQGLGGALALPTGRLMILRAFEGHHRITAMGRVAIIASLGAMLGPVMGGFITHHFSWRWIFWINFPVGVLAMLLAFYCLKNDTPRKNHPLDKVGFILFGASLAGFTFGLSALSESTLKWSTACICLSVSAFLLLSYLWHSRKKTHPLIKNELFFIRTFRISVMGNLFSRLGFGGIPFILPLLLQIGLHYSAQISGLLLAPLAIGIILVRPFTLQLFRLFGYKRLLILNTVLLSFSTCSFMIIGGNTAFSTICFLVFLFGFLISLQYSAMNSLAYTSIVVDDLSAATSIVSTLQQLAQSFGVAISALFIRYFSSLTTPKFLLTTAVFHRTVIAISVITFLAAFIFVRLKADDGGEFIHSH